MTIGIFAGSLDPVTEGHTWVIQQACTLVDKLFIAIGVNPDKTPYFSAAERKHLLTEVLRSRLSANDFAKVEVVFIERWELLVHYARKVGASHLFRGIRNVKDFEYEKGMAAINSKFEPSISSVFLMTPAKYAEVSSSLVKGLVGFEQWEAAVQDWVHPVVISAFKARVNVSRDA
ncbi:pantetheine-phosphate adenylyltransferase [Burkholderia cenocepacia]|uniref:pantetheine-phosphate adenylyltransferase n=1 Tax=Burkholderia cenocepacia TaxID=95486 RepID=UPI0007621DD4|nr:pantetheine-phosphate adenylyltransferase [Burkholderia cenocepacia]KWU19145.1 hypothetical protein AS149_12925 [Burkholderia cenocepacia]